MPYPTDAALLERYAIVEYVGYQREYGNCSGKCAEKNKFVTVPDSQEKGYDQSGKGFKQADIGIHLHPFVGNDCSQKGNLEDGTDYRYYTSGRVSV